MVLNMLFRVIISSLIIKGGYMGLDMNAYKTKFQPDSQIDFRVPQDEETEELYYWRKHPNLHGWMNALYESKGGKEEFNCVNVQLTLEDLEKLKEDLVNDTLPSTSGFFFGKSFGGEEEKKHDLVFIDLAKEAIEDGYTVYYTSWW